MKTIGMIGGVSWQATIDYYRIINEAIGKRLGGNHSANLLMACVDFDVLVELSMAGNWDEIAKILAGEVKKLEGSGADFFMICANTLHKVASSISGNINVPILHIVEATAEKIKERNIKRVALLGTSFTMEDGFYQECMREHDIEVLIPAKEDGQLVHKVIYEELIKGIISDSSREEYIRIINVLIAGGAEGLILGCTEIPLLIKQKHVSVPIFDTTRIHAEAAVDMVLA